MKPTKRTSAGRASATPRTAEPTTAEVVSALSSPVAPELLRGPDLTRRRFLQAAGVAGVATLLPGWLAEAAAAATPLRPDQGVLVMLTMTGGNDGLDTFIPIADGAYYDARPGLAIPASSAIRLSDHRGLNPRLPYLKSLWDQGRLAVVDGIGQDDATLSHFVSMGQMMAGRADGRPGSSGWLGRILDGLPDEPLTGVAIGSSIPLLVQGDRNRASAVPRQSGDLRQLDPSDPVQALQLDAVRALSGGPSGLGALGDEMNAGFGQAIELSGRLRPLIEETRDEPAVISDLRLAARLINADLGIRVISIMFGDFDSHANQASMHRARMEELNAGLETFFTTLHPDFADRALLVGTSEFGRRVRANADGTDHGTANSLFAIGSRVNGGFHGQAPSLTALDRHGNLVPTVDYRHFYGNLVATWLGADSSEILGRDWGDLGFLRSPGSAGGSTRPDPIAVADPRTKRAEVARLYLAYFLRPPDEEGFEYWLGVRNGGRSLAGISAEFAASREFGQRYGALSNRQFVDLIYRNVLRRSPDAEGLAYWKATLDRGVSRGDVMIGFSESTEFRNRTSGEVAAIDRTGPVGRLYRAYFLRAPDDAGLDYWLGTGLPKAAISEQFAASTEFRNRYGTLDDRAFVTMAYRNVLGREPDQAGLDHWLGVLRRGTGRGAVMLGFSDSPEFVSRVKSM